MKLVFKKRTKNQVGFKYVEVDTINKVYATGNSGSHAGFGYVFKAGGVWLDTYVPTTKALKEIQSDLALQGFKEVDNMHEYHEQL